MQDSMKMHKFNLSYVEESGLVLNFILLYRTLKCAKKNTVVRV